MNPLRAAVIGTGALGKHHARILSGLQGVNLSAIAELHEASGRAVADKHNTRWVADYHDLLGEIDMAVVAVPTVAHFRIARELLSAGVDLFVEKPLTPTADQARELVELAEEQGRILQVGHVERFNPGFVAARAAIHDPKYIRSERVSPYTYRSTDIGVVFDMMIHDIDLVLNLVGQPLVSVEAFGVSIMGGHEDAVQARLRFTGGCIADLSANRVSPTTSRAMQVWSSDGCAQIDFGARESQIYSATPTLLFGTPPLERVRQPGANLEQLKAEVFGTYIGVEKPLATPRDQLTEELVDFERAVRTRSAPQVDGAQGLAAVEVAEAILGSVAAHQWDASPQGRVGALRAAPLVPLKKAG
ncbi:MAG: Gfo/Idh/MocA family oxidoreductase [Planctomycetota bacterium]|nr:Gfo/Idh/MocA family oxidoreductase [Planctomycetota bacterium]